MRSPGRSGGGEVRFEADNLLGQYLSNVTSHPRVTREQEIDLARRIQCGDVEALKVLVRANLRLVLKVVWRYRSHRANFMDLINEGNIGLIYASRKYNPNYGLKFSSYAVWWIKQSITLYLVQFGKGPISVPIRKVLLLHKLQRESERLRSKLRRAPSVDELALRLGLQPAVVADALRSVPEYSGWDEGSAPAADEGPDVERDVDRRLCASIVHGLLGGLAGQERRGVELYYGLEGAAENNFAEIGRELSMSREGARQLVKRSLVKLRSLPETESLKAYL